MPFFYVPNLIELEYNKLEGVIYGNFRVNYFNLFFGSILF